ncbi:hydroxyacid dehydrogenase [Parafrankia colletiae]|uniref:Hydroxyacid dehydrogenase n=1 Tax=Parafrankia colletiae TaxID=573497 RepID=A0A1S1QWM5_9ACTN|nr:hydroxyacid dehydrogenase [Parafrankia colletiae]MCK9899630.1 hydroxyacid dehydrogenase [Frankia sp. Cpl3]OHV37949.1 hydroxyacid dehydrogenase [Parafrankia colletiae]
MPDALFALAPRFLSGLFPPPVLRQLQEAVHVDPALATVNLADPALAPLLAQAEVLVTGWGCPRLDEAVLARAPRLRAVLHTAGSVRGLVSDACWDRGVAVSSAAAANALPVAEYTLAAILLSGKNAFALRDGYREGGPLSPLLTADPAGVGNHGRRVGIIGASHVGRRVLDLLRRFDLTVLLHDPYVTPAGAAELNAELLPLDDLLRSSDVVSVHAPDLPETYRMLDRRRLALIRDGGVVINTARGALIDPEALADELTSGRLCAVLDVTEPEPLPAESPLHRLPNVFLTPHISGSAGNELARLGHTVAQEAARFTAGLPLAHPVRRDDLARIA